MSLGTAHPLRLAEPNTQECAAVFTGAGAADCVKVDGDGIASIAYSAATGEFLLTFTDVGVSILWMDVQCHTADGSAPTFGKTVGTVSLSAKTIPLEFWDLAVPAKKDPASGDRVQVRVLWKKTS